MLARCTRLCFCVFAPLRFCDSLAGRFHASFHAQMVQARRQGRWPCACLKLACKLNPVAQVAPLQLLLSLALPNPLLLPAAVSALLFIFSFVCSPVSHHLTSLPLLRRVLLVCPCCSPFPCLGASPHRLPHIHQIRTLPPAASRYCIIIV